MKVFADFQGAFYKKPLEARFGTAVPTVDEKIKNADFSAFFVSDISRGCPPQTPTHRTFREKSFGISKAFVK